MRARTRRGRAPTRVVRRRSEAAAARRALAGSRRRRIAAEAGADHLDHGPFGSRDVVVAAAAAEHPARQDRLDAAVEDEAREARVEVTSELAVCLPADDDALDRGERLRDRVHALLQRGAARDLADEDADEVGLAAPGAEHDRRHLAELLARRRARELHLVDRGEELA